MFTFFSHHGCEPSLTICRSTTVKLIITHCISLKALEDSMWEEDVHARYHGYKMYQDTLYNDPARNGVLSTCMR